MYSTTGILRNGKSIRIRSAAAEDASGLLDLFRSLSDTVVYPRYFALSGTNSSPDIAGMERLCSPVAGHEIALVATENELGIRKIIGFGRCERDPNLKRTASFTLAVHEAWQGKGVGTLLLEHLAAIAQLKGIDRFEGLVLGEKRHILETLRKSGLRGTRTSRGDEVQIEISTEATAEFERASIEREMEATAKSLEAFFVPSSVAVIGASSRPGSIGAALVHNLLEPRFPGDVYPVSLHADRIFDLPVHRSVEDIPGSVDLALIAVPMPQVEETINACIRKGVKGVVVVSSGFAELSPEGREVEQRMTEAARSAGMRLVGPNCMGLLNTDPAFCGVFAGRCPPAGNIAMVSQSGALGIAILDYVSTYNLGISNFLSIGNLADVSVNDLLSYWAFDDRTKVIALYLESFGNPDKFARIAPMVARSKPIVAVKSGRTAAGSRAASSHSASLASVDVAVDAVFRQAGVIRTETLEELFDIAKVLSSQPLPAGPRVGVVTNAGGPGILLADALEVHNLTLPSLSERTIGKLREILPFQAGLANPIDMLAYANGDIYEKVVELVASDENVDTVIVIYVPPVITDPGDVAAGIARGAAKSPAGKPVMTVFLSSSERPPEELHKGSRGRIPAFVFPENAAKALSEVEQYARWRDRDPGLPFCPPDSARVSARQIVEDVLAENSALQWLSPERVGALLGSVGIRTAQARVFGNRDEASSGAKDIPYPVVLKIVSPDILHKSDEGGVILGIRNRQALLRAIDKLAVKMEARKARIEGFLVQEEIAGGVEFLVGVTRDPVFGHLLVAGLGGTYVELFKDVSFCLPPVTGVDAREMLDQLKARKLLDGFRGSAPVDRAALEEVIMRISALVEIVPEVRELDLNPVKVLEQGRGAVVVDARIRVGA